MLGHGLCKAMGEICCVGIISSLFSVTTPLTLQSLLVYLYSIPSFCSGSHHFKCHSAFITVIPIPPVTLILLSPAASPLFFSKKHRFCQLKLKRSLLKERINHLSHLMSSAIDTEKQHSLRPMKSHLHHL